VKCKCRAERSDGKAQTAGKSFAASRGWIAASPPRLYRISWAWERRHRRPGCSSELAKASIQVCFCQRASCGHFKAHCLGKFACFPGLGACKYLASSWDFELACRLSLSHYSLFFGTLMVCHLFGAYLGLVSFQSAAFVSDSAGLHVHVCCN